MFAPMSLEERERRRERATKQHNSHNSHHSHKKVLPYPSRSPKRQKSTLNFQCRVDFGVELTSVRADVSGGARKEAGACVQSAQLAQLTQEGANPSQQVTEVSKASPQLSVQG